LPQLRRWLPFLLLMLLMLWRLLCWSRLRLVWQLKLKHKGGVIGGHSSWVPAQHLQPHMQQQEAADCKTVNYCLAAAQRGCHRLGCCVLLLQSAPSFQPNLDRWPGQVIGSIENSS